MLDITSIDGFEIAFRSRTADVKVLRNSFGRDRFFREVPEYRASETDVIIDVGAHIGTFSLLASSKVERGKVYAIEACRESANYCRINAALNRISNIHVANLALSNQQGHATLHYANENWGHSIVAENTRRGKESVATDSLGNFLRNNGIAHCSFMKLNCEGAEFPIILSSSADVLRQVSIFVILYHCDVHPSHTEEDLIRHLTLSGFSTSVRYKRRRRGWVIAIRR